nr:immunoglobulin light chain junction region [Mus musculus]NSL98064.1 immunoglobulin light chain junction region [Mus musculus]NSL99727.1 immunoglobulin light chain junction region [Mus musculus]NSM02452.1 immunoglobulin light chain junction region [Mus musculus]
CQHHYGIPLTF